MAEEKTTSILIKKYANRRLYDTSTSKYITLDDLCQMVKRGVEFTVVDAKSGDDLTRSVLTQIIFDQESKGYNILPISFLRHIISFYDDSLRTVLPSYLETSMENFARNQDRMRVYFDQYDQYSPLRQLEELGKQNMQMFEQMMDMFNPFSTLGGASQDSDDKSS